MKKVCVLLLLLSIARGIDAQQWPFHGGDPGQTKYSVLDQINRSNVANCSSRGNGNPAKAVPGIQRDAGTV